MASPFKVFRKHQKLMLAGLTILAMFSFVFLGSIGNLLDTGQAKNPVVVRTGKYGKLTARDLSIMRQDHNLFLQIITKIFAKAAGESAEISIKRIENIFGSSSDEDLVTNWLKSQRAEEIGMVISNKTINDFLQVITNGNLAARDISEIIKQQGLSDNQFFNIIREELRALEVTRLFTFSLEGFTPAQRWEYFCQLRKQAAVELIPVEVEQFLDQVKPPSEEELNALFEKYKDKLPNPNSPEPGFRVPHKIDVQYLKADFAKLSDPATITDEEFQNTYEKNRAYFDQLEMQESKSITPEKKAEQEKEKTPEQEKKETAPAGEKSPEQPKEQPAGKQKPADQPGALPEKSPQADTKKDTKKEDAPKSSALDRTPFSLTSLTEQDAKPAAEGPKTAKPAAEGPKTEKPAAEQPKTEKPAAEQPKPENPAANQPAQPEKAEQAKPALSEKTKEKIRAQVAREKIRTVLLKVQQVMEENGKKWRKYEADKIQKKQTIPPPKLDFDVPAKGGYFFIVTSETTDGKNWHEISREMIKSPGFTSAKTGMISVWEAHKFDIGSSYMGEALSPFSIAAFKSSLTLYKPDSAVDIQGNDYLFWKIDDTPESEPSLKDENVRQEVLHAWKLIKARELARKQAESMAEAASKSGATLKGAFPELPEERVISPPPFSMLTEGSVPRGSSPVPPRLSEVEGAPMVGMDFMRAVFNLDLNQVGVAMNLPQTVVYVVQLIKYSPPQDVLWQIFLAEDFSKYSVVADIDLQADQKAWLESLKTSAGLKWESKPEQPRGEPAPDSFPED